MCIRDRLCNEIIGASIQRLDLDLLLATHGQDYDGHLRFRADMATEFKPGQIRHREISNCLLYTSSKDLKVSYEEYPTKVAIEEKGALGQFGDRYGDNVKVYKMIADGADKPYSFEICGGPHVDHTLQLSEGGKKFKIIKEESSSSGIRRIKAVLA